MKRGRYVQEKWAENVTARFAPSSAGQVENSGLPEKETPHCDRSQKKAANFQ